MYLESELKSILGMESTETSTENTQGDDEDLYLKVKSQSKSVKFAKTYHGKSPSYQRICGNEANLNAHGDLGYDDNNLLNQKQSAMSVVTDQGFENLNKNVKMVLQGTTDDSTGGILTLANGTPNVLGFQPNTS